MINLKEAKETINNYIFSNLYPTDEYRQKIMDSMKYTLSSGGKKMRPILTILTYTGLTKSNDYKKVLPYACAIEYIHTYSLIHDDLPAIDNDDFRRGEPSNHKVYSEAIAILSGDGLLNLSMELLSKEIEKYETFEEMKRGLRALKYIYTATGVKGMIGGQVIDIDYGSLMNLDICELMYKLKTAALIRAAIISSAIMFSLNEKEMASLEMFANYFGIAYQIKDDLEDSESDLKSNKNGMFLFQTKKEMKNKIKELMNRAYKELNNVNANLSDLKEYTAELMRDID